MMEKKDILIIHGTDYKNMTIRILKRAGLAELIGDRNKRIGLARTLQNAEDVYKRQGSKRGSDDPC